jgi:hypothetical protein
MFHASSWAQDKIIRIKSGEDARKVIPVTEKYRFEEFADGKIQYFNSVSTGKLNYSILLGEMHFIDFNRDTLSLANEHLIKMVNIGERNFYYHNQNGYLEEIADYGTAKLAVRQIMQVVNNEKMGAYGHSTTVASIRTYSSYATGNSQLQRLQIPGDMLLAKNVSYFIIDHNNRVHAANKTSFLKVFAKHKKSIASYIRAQAIDFKDEKDIRKLLLFCSQLT